TRTRRISSDASSWPGSSRCWMTSSRWRSRMLSLPTSLIWARKLSSSRRRRPASAPPRADQQRRGIAIATLGPLTLELEPDAHGHLKLRNLAIFDGAALLYHLEPVHVTDRPGGLGDCGFHRFGEAVGRCADHVDELVRSGHRGAPCLVRGCLPRLSLCSSSCAESATGADFTQDCAEGGVLQRANSVKMGRHD